MEEKNAIKEKLKTLPKSKTMLLEEYERTGSAQISVKPDGTVVYPFGQMPSVLVCAPLRICTIQLEENEVPDKPFGGDTVRWIIKKATQGNRVLVTVKPVMQGLSTNIVIATNKRTYNIELRSSKTESMPSIAFWYPDDDLNEKWSNDADLQKIKKKDDDITVATLNTQKLNFSYKVDGNAREYLIPVRVYDDGQQVIIQMSEEMKHKEAPALLVLDAQGNKKQVLFRVKGSNYIVDKLFDRAEMIIGHDEDSQEVVTITRSGYKEPEKVSVDYSKRDFKNANIFGIEY